MRGTLQALTIILYLISLGKVETYPPIKLKKIELPYTVLPVKSYEEIINDFKDDSFGSILDNYYIYDHFGTYSTEGLENKYHCGSDYESYKNANIYSPSNAMVVKKGYILKDAGIQIYLVTKVDDIVYGIIMCHLNEITVDYGPVVKGQVIGKVGNTGFTYSYCVHLELYKLGYGNLYDYLNHDFKFPRYWCKDRLNPEDYIK